MQTKFIQFTESSYSGAVHFLWRVWNIISRSSKRRWCGKNVEKTPRWRVDKTTWRGDPWRVDKNMTRAQLWPFLHFLLITEALLSPLKLICWVSLLILLLLLLLLLMLLSILSWPASDPDRCLTNRVILLLCLFFLDLVLLWCRLPSLTWVLHFYTMILQRIRIIALFMTVFSSGSGSEILISLRLRLSKQNCFVF